jgi:hypothetical protein
MLINVLIVIVLTILTTGFHARGTLYPQVPQARLSVDRIRLSENADPIAYLPPAVQQGYQYLKKGNK